jgi:phosphoenolpyruvate carboxylase
MNLASAASIAKHFNLPTPPIFEVILPMTETSEEILAIQVAFQEMHNLKHPMYRLEHILSNLRVIPLFEQVSTIMRADAILKKYLEMYKKEFKKMPPYMRPYVARSDPALNSGMVATVLAIKIALSRFRKLEEKLKIPLFPIIGAAALPFRGGINPETVEDFTNEYKGVRTTTIQSAFRYDYKKSQVKKAIARLEELFPKQKAVVIPSIEKRKIQKIIHAFESYYQETIEKFAPIINKIATNLPKRRERVQHIGLFGYSRGVGKIRLPRAIAFTASLYSIGIPPELIGTGRGINFAKENNLLTILEKYYINLKTDLIRSGGFLNKEVLSDLSKSIPIAKQVEEDVKAIEEYLGIELKPFTKAQKEHLILSTKIYKKFKAKQPFEKLVEQAAVIRKSLG